MHYEAPQEAYQEKEAQKEAPAIRHGIFPPPRRRGIGDAA
jgi:hypothetical protein